jgi:3-hydroxyisobutyrate dehydrogenase
MMSGNRRLGFVGLGMMGNPMVRHLAAKGFAPTVYDVDRAAVERLSDVADVRIAASLAELAGASDIVITMLPDGKVVRRAVMGDPQGSNDCLLAGLRTGAVIVDMSSSDPFDTRDLGAALSAHGLRLLDAPVSGGIKGAHAATLAIMAGGDVDVLDGCRHILLAMGRAVHHAGPLGAGHAAKALNNYVSAAGLLAAVEAVVAGQRFGLDPAGLIDIINDSTGRNNSTETKVRQQILSRAFAGGFALNLMAKDLRTALGLARQSGLTLPLAETCVEVWNRAEAVFDPGVDHTAIARLVEDINGEVLGSP